ncbi:hypothetical protein AN958_06733 [Leucoagaricus sp. SymC.cos]|nr:hypothetical protein AN958_06733 [Leucoagaricus sp. SymC.cos]
MDPSGPTASGSNGRQKRILPSRSRRGGPGVGSCETDLMILEHQKRRFENDDLIPSTTPFYLTTDSKQFATSNDQLRLTTVSNERYFDRPDVLAAFRKGLSIQTPSWAEGQPDVGRFRPRGVEDTQVDTSDVAYERRHRKYETFEKRQRLREKEKLKHEQYKLKERIEQLRVMDASAFLALPASNFSPAPAVLEEEVDASLAALPGAPVNGAAVYNEGERRRKEMLDIALALEARFRVLLPPDRIRKPQTQHTMREVIPNASSPALVTPRHIVSDAELSERDEVVFDDASSQRQDKLKIKLKLSGKDSASGSPTPTSTSRTSKRSGRMSQPPTQKHKRHQPRPTSSRSPTPTAEQRIKSPQPSTLAAEEPTPPEVTVEKPLDDQLGPESEEEQTSVSPDHPVSAPDQTRMPDTKAIKSNFHEIHVPTPSQRQAPLPDTRLGPAPEVNSDIPEHEGPYDASEPPQSLPLPEEEYVDIEALPEPPQLPRFPSPPPIETLRAVSTSPQPPEVGFPVRRRGRPRKPIEENSRLLELANAVQSISAGPPPAKRAKTRHERLPVSEQQSMPTPPSETTFPPSTVERPLLRGKGSRAGTTPLRQSPPNPPSSGERADSAAPSAEAISSFFVDPITGKRKGAKKTGRTVEYQSPDSGALRRTDSLLLIAGIRGSLRQTQRHQMAFGVKVPEEIMAPYEFWLPDEYLPEEERLKWDN